MKQIILNLLFPIIVQECKSYILYVWQLVKQHRFTMKDCMYIFALLIKLLAYFQKSFNDLVWESKV